MKRIVSGNAYGYVMVMRAQTQCCFPLSEYSNMDSFRACADVTNGVVDTLIPRNIIMLEMK